MKSVTAAMEGLLIFLLFMSPAIMAQEKTGNMTSEEKVKVIEKVVKLLNNNYVFPEVAEKIEKHLKSKLADGSFDKVTDKKEFAELMTTEVQSVSHDKHMRVRLRPQQPKSPTEKPNPLATLYERKKAEEERNYGFARVEKLEDNVGLLEITGFPPLQFAKEYADLAMKFLTNSDALIIDCRRNGGGNPDLIQYVCSYLFEKPTHINSIYTRENNKTEDFITFEKVDGKKLPDVPLFVLTSSRTFSGGEEFAYDIQTQKRGILIGETTGGGANPGGMFPVTDDIGIFIPTGRAINPVTKTNWEGTGVKPDIEVEASKALETALPKAREAAKAHRLAGDRVVYKLIDETGLNMEKAEKLASEKKGAEADELVKSTIEKGVHNGLLDENTINMMGYDYLGKESYAMALSIFRLNTVLYPKSANVFDSMGEAYMKSGDKANAILNYRKSLDMNPKNTNAAETLKKLGAM